MTIEASERCEAPVDFERHGSEQVLNNWSICERSITKRGNFY